MQCAQTLLVDEGAEARSRRYDELLAKQEITEALYRYCRGDDRLDASLSQSLWHPDGPAEYGPKGVVFIGPTNEWAQRIHPGLAKLTGKSHRVSNILIELDGERAVSEAYVSATLWRNSVDQKLWQRTMVGRYLDRWSRRAGRWAVDHRRYIFDFSYESEDPSYTVLGTLAKKSA
jgi:SnoaL-like domain